MKPIELFQLWTQFEAMIDSKSLSLENKVAIGGEWLSSLPPKQLCVSSQLSYDVVKEAMQGRLNDLKEEINGRTVKETPKGKKAEEGQKPRQSKNRSSEKPVHKNAGNP
jgi:hypothetical protein